MKAGKTILVLGSLGVGIVAIIVALSLNNTSGLPTFELDADEVGIEYLAHSSFRIHSPSGSRILIDPWASRAWLGYDLPKSVLTDPVDAVAITHSHADHNAGIRDVTWPPGAQLIREPGHHVIGDIEISGIAGKHAAGHAPGEENTMFLCELAGLRIVHLGDNEPLSDSTIEALGRVDILMIPIDSEEHILKYSHVSNRPCLGQRLPVRGGSPTRVSKPGE